MPNRRNTLEVEFNPEQEQIFLGTMLGDGNLTHQTYNAHFRLIHRNEDKDYLFWKYDKLKDTGIFLNSPYHRPNSLWRLNSRHLPIFTYYYHLFYPNGKKVVPMEALYKLNSLGLAVWYMDDGHLSSGNQINLATHSFSQDENNLIIRWFRERFNLNFHLRHGCNEKVSLNLVGGRMSRLEFINIVSPYIVDCMLRKIKLAQWLSGTVWKEYNYGKN